ncbi:UNVERIFIED_CONTAM: hypothetical protein LK11_16310 [Mumia flava]
MSSVTDDAHDRSPLDAEAVAAALRTPGSWWRDVRIVAESASTNADLRALAAAGAPEGTLVSTDHQTAGRGRLDRGWETPWGSALATSVLLRPDVPAERWTWLPLLTGVAVVDALADVGVDVLLKWPNDVVAADDRKIAGILLERVETPSGPAAVVGCGINVTVRADEIGVPTAVSLADLGATSTDRTTLLVAYASALERRYAGWAAAGGDPAAGLRDAYLAVSATVGRPVRATFADGSTLEGDAVGIDTGGRVEIAAAGRVSPVSAGDVVHLRPRT